MAGTYYQPLPLDYLLLEQMPEKAILGGVHWAGRKAKHLRESVIETLPAGAPAVTTSEVMARLRSMKVAGFCEDFKATGGRIWARTEAGTAHVNAKGEVLG